MGQDQSSSTMVAQHPPSALWLSRRNQRHHLHQHHQHCHVRARMSAAITTSSSTRLRKPVSHRLEVASGQIQMNPESQGRKESAATEQTRPWTIFNLLPEQY